MTTVTHPVDPVDPVDHVDPVPLLRAMIAARYGTQVEAALRWGGSPNFVSMVLHGHKAPTEQMLTEAGLRRVTVYRSV